MNITILDTIKLHGIPSGSGLIKTGSAYHIVGDDSPSLFTLNSDFEVTSKIPLLNTTEFLDIGRIIKSEKPDFEATELIEENEI